MELVLGVLVAIVAIGFVSLAVTLSDFKHH